MHRHGHEHVSVHVGAYLHMCVCVISKVYRSDINKQVSIPVCMGVYVSVPDCA